MPAPFSFIKPPASGGTPDATAGAIVRTPGNVTFHSLISGWYDWSNVTIAVQSTGGDGRNVYYASYNQYGDIIEFTIYYSSGQWRVSTVIDSSYTDYWYAPASSVMYPWLAGTFSYQAGISVGQYDQATFTLNKAA